MKTNFALIAIFAGAALMSCQKETELGPAYLTNDSRQLRGAGLTNPQSVTTNRVEHKFIYNSQGELEQMLNAGRTQKRFEYDGEGRLVVLALPESNEEIRYRYDSGNFPVDAIRIKGTEEVSDIVFSFDESGRKISDIETERSSGHITEFTYEYDETDRLLSTMKKQNDELISLIRPDGFIEGYSHLANLLVLSLEPGVSLQTGLPSRLLIDDQSGHSEIEYTYALDSQLQPERFTTSTNGRRTVKSIVLY